MRDVVTALPDESAVDAAQRMAALRVGDLVIVETFPGELARPIGIVTDRDLIVRVLAHPELVPRDTKLGDIMAPGIVTAAEDDDVESIVAKMQTHTVRRIPVVDLDGRLQGVVSIDDVIGWMRDEIQTATNVLERQGEGPLFRNRAR